MNTRDAIDKAITAAGGQVALAKALDIRQPSVAGWRKSGRIPAERVLRVSELTGVPPHELRPDIYPAGTSLPAPPPATEAQESAA